VDFRLNDIGLLLINFAKHMACGFIQNVVETRLEYNQFPFTQETLQLSRRADEMSANLLGS
jgi:hypothetical protein